jgi:hypothetical protein
VQVSWADDTEVPAQTIAPLRNASTRKRRDFRALASAAIADSPFDTSPPF